MVGQEFLRLKPSKNNVQKQTATVLVLGGSTGARRINEAVWECLEELTKHCAIAHQTGEHSIDEAQQIRRALKNTARSRYTPIAFISEELPTLMQQASVVVSRAGANSIFELATLAKPTVIIPLSNSANNHQVHNGQYLVEHHAAHIIPESHLTPKLLTETIEYLLKHPGTRTELGGNLHKLATPDAAADVAQLIIEAAQHAR